MSKQILDKIRKNLLQIDPYVPGKPISEVKKEFGLTEVIKLASNENPVGPSKKAQQAIIDALPELSRYPDGGAVLLKQAIAEKNDIDTASILIGNGSDEVIKLLSETFIEGEDEVIIPSPTFSQYWFGTQLMAGTTVTVDSKPDFTFDLDAIVRRITPRTKLIYLCTPNNPTGTYIKSAELQAFLQQVPEDVLVVLDEAYQEYVEATDFAQGIDFVKQGHRNVLVMRTFSKLYALAALRIGYIIGDAQVIEAINRSREPFNVNTMAQVAAVAALNDDEHIATSRRVNREGMAQLIAGLQDLGYSPLPSQANFLLFPTGMDDSVLFAALLKEGIIARSGTALGVPGHLRVTVGTKAENEKFLAALKRVLLQLDQKV
ncbi:MAG TPA: histidinol-phosphate transaminase [Bacilli bacterium]|nr:histidinol-phosphate transaminase [Bacilli bacterium]